jgi:hypothetical protein
MTKLVLVAIIMTILFCPSLSYGVPQILTTYRDDGNATIWDGKWTFTQEWKRTSEDIVQYVDGNELSVKTGHDHKNLYVFLDFITQHVFRKHSDYGLVCIVVNQTSESRPQNDDYCFLSPLGSHNPLTFQGGGDLAETNYFVKIENDPELIAVGGISDDHDRYSPIPHTSYEFRIPIVKLVGSSDIYGFYVAVYNSHDGLSYSWPQNITNSSFPTVPPPSSWGQLISPDKSLPEFPLPSLMMISSMILVIYVSKRYIHSINRLVR